MSNPYVVLTYAKDGVQLTRTVEVTGGGATISVSGLVVPANTTDLEIDIAYTANRLKLLFVASDKSLTLEANSASVPTYTLTLEAGKPLVWYSGSGLTNPTTGSTTRLYATNAGAEDATLEIRVEQDPTP